MGDMYVFNSTNDAIPAQGERNQGNEAVVKKQAVGGPRRKGLADITNLPVKRKVSGKDGLMCDQDPIQQLRQENATLMKQLVERNKMIELCGIELQNLRANLQKYKQQNWQLAQANSQILSQLNAGKDKLKVLGHELVCRNNLLAVKSSEVKSGQCQEIHSETTCKEEGVSSPPDSSKDKPCRTNSRQHSRARGQSVAKGGVAEENLGSRYPKRRHSLRFKSVDIEPAEDMLDTNGEAFRACRQSMDGRPEVCPMSETSRKVSEESLVSSSADIDGSRPCVTDAKHVKKAKCGSIVKCPVNDEKFKTKRPRPRTRSSILKSEEKEDFKVDADSVASPQNEGKELEECTVSLSPSVNTKDLVKEEVDLSIAQEVRSIHDVKVTLQDTTCSGGTQSRQQRVTELSTVKGASQVEKTEIKSPCSRRQSSGLKCKDEEASGCCPQSDDKEKPENPSMQMTLSDNTEKMDRKHSDILPEQVKRFSVGRPLRRAAEKVQSYKEVPLKVKMRRPG